MDCFRTTVNLGYCDGAIPCLQEYGQEQTYPCFIDIKIDFLNHPRTRRVIPLACKQPTNSQVKVLSPVLAIRWRRLCDHDPFTDDHGCKKLQFR